MAGLLLPGTRDFLLAVTAISYVGLTINHSVNALYTIETLWTGLRLLYAANAEGSKRWRSWKTDAAWDSEVLAEIRRAIEEEA